MSESTPRRRLARLVAAAGLAAAALGGLGAGPGSAAAADLLQGPATFPLDGPAAALATGDLDRDGRPDAALVLATEDALVVFLSDPAEILGPPVRRPAGSSPLHVVAGDLDRKDGPDLVVTNSGESTISVFLNRGDGGFLDPSTHPVGTGPRVAQLADFDQDGILDAAVSNLGSSDVDVLLGDGAGGFRPRARLPVGDNPHFVLADDLDGDGRADLTVAHRDDRYPYGQVAWFRSLGGASFAPDVPTDLAEWKAVPRLLASGDFDRDGDLDLVVYSNEGRLLHLANRGPGIFDVRLESDTETSVGWMTGFLLARDLDEDGNLDILAPLGRHGDHGARAHLGRGDGTFARRDIYLDGRAASVAAEDLDLDGVPDLLVALGDLPYLSFHRGTSPGRVECRTVVELEEAPRDLAARDLDGDGLADLIVLGAAGVRTVPALGGGAFGPPSPVRIAGGSLQGLRAGDWDGDGRVEVASADLVRGSVIVADLHPSGEAGGTIEHPVHELPAFLASADFDRDGLEDLAVGHRASPVVSILWRPASPDAPPGRDRRLDLAVGAFQTALDAADADGDGDMDLAVATREGLQLWLGDGAGAFPESRRADGLASAPAVRLADLDGSGAAELLVALRDRVWIVRDPARSVDPAREELDLGAEVRPLAAGDIDRDGLVDLVVGHPGEVSALRGLPGGTFEAPRRHTVGTSPLAVILADLDGDGILDAATADSGSLGISILRGAARAPAPRSRRGDADADGRATLTDAVVLLEHLFRGGAEPSCPDAADSDDDGALRLTDAVYLLLYLFQGGPAPPAPGPDDCGEDPTDDDLGACASACA